MSGLRANMADLFDVLSRDMPWRQHFAPPQPKAREREVSIPDLDDIELHILDCLCERAEATIAEFTKGVGWHPSVVQRRAEKLKEMGMVHCREMPNPKPYWWSITPLGRLAAITPPPQRDTRKYAGGSLDRDPAEVRKERRARIFGDDKGQNRRSQGPPTAEYIRPERGEYLQTIARYIARDDLPMESEPCTVKRPDGTTVTLPKGAEKVESEGAPRPKRKRPGQGKRKSEGDAAD